MLSGCAASPAQLQQTENDAFKLAGCVLSAIIGGMTDPAALAGQCVGALPAVVVDVINDFAEKPVAAQIAIVGSPLTDAQLNNLTTALRNAVAAQAQKVGGK